jgi:hypothetical protein
MNSDHNVAATGNFISNSGSQWLEMVNLTPTVILPFLYLEFIFLVPILYRIAENGAEFLQVPQNE